MSLYMLEPYEYTMICKTIKRTWYLTVKSIFLSY